MKYVKPVVTIYDDETIALIEALASSTTCNCSSTGARAASCCCNPNPK